MTPTPSPQTPDPQPLPEARYQVSTDAMSAAASFLSRNWGDYGCRIGVAASWGGSGVFSCTHFDGSRFHIFADRYGNACQVESWTDVEAAMAKDREVGR